MEFADSSCSRCGADFGEAKPEKVTRLDTPYETPYGRVVEFVGPCPSCGEDIPLWGGEEVPDREPAATTEPTEPPEPIQPAEPPEPTDEGTGEGGEGSEE